MPPWVTLTTPTKEPVHINSDQVERVRHATYPEAPRGAFATLDLQSGRVQHVTETREQVMALFAGLPIHGD
jgi:hypothetical protein